MSDSSDIDFSDDDALFEQRKQELLQQQQANQPRDPFAAQFDPTSPTYHGGHDSRPVQLGGQSRLPTELQKQYGSTAMNIEDMPDVVDNAFQEDPAQFGVVYHTIYNLREASLNVKRVFAKLQGLLQEHLRFVESNAVPSKVKGTLSNLQQAIDVLKTTLPDLNKHNTTLLAFSKEDLVNGGVANGVVSDFDTKYHSRVITTTITNIETLTKVTDEADKATQEQDLYFNMKKITTELTTRQAEMLSLMKTIKRTVKK